LRPGDLVQCVDDCGYLQAGLAIASCRREQLLSGLAEIAGAPYRREDLLGREVRRCRYGAQRHLLGEP
jgi:hypothetical protein